MFEKLRNKIIVFTMAITTAVLVIAGASIMMFASEFRPEPRTSQGFIEGEVEIGAGGYNQEITQYIKNDRDEGKVRLAVTLLCIGVLIEMVVFVTVYYTSQRIIEPVKESHEKQKVFIANASHELKTPLAVIQANMEAMEVNAENEKWKKNMEREVEHASKMVLDLVQLARMDAEGGAGRGVGSGLGAGVGSGDSGSDSGDSGGAAEIKEMDVARAIRERIEAFRPKFAGEMSYKSKVESVKCRLDRQEFVQVLDILLDNATKYGEKEIVVSLDKGELVVVNDGAVVGKEEAEKVFDRFYQADKAREGAGLGLAIAKAVCEKNGWRIHCEGERGRTKFVVEW